MKLIIAVLLLVGSELSEGKTSCSVAIKDLKSNQPLFLRPGSSTTWPITDSGFMEFSAGEKIELFCGTDYSKPSGISGSQLATCNSGTHFQIGRSSEDLTQVACSRSIGLKARKTGASCNGGIVIETGFEVGSRFVKQMDICFDEDLEVTRYVKYNLEACVKFHQTNVDRLNFAKHGFFGKKSLEMLYRQKTISGTFKEQLGNNQNYDTNIVRGHIAAMADFAYGTQQRATFLFLNAAPQWQSINNGNWKRTEDQTRSWVMRTKRNVECYSGVFDVTTLPNGSGVQTPLYLDFQRNGPSAIPIPMLYFRVIIEPSTRKGVVLITINNPHQELREYHVCPDVTRPNKLVTWDNTKIEKGISYACEVAEFAKKNPYLPAFNVVGLLEFN